MCSHRKASFSEHERLGVFKILRRENRKKKKKKQVTGSFAGLRITALCGRVVISKTTYFLGRRDVVDIRPERHRHGKHTGQFDTVTERRRHSRRTAVS